MKNIAPFVTAHHLQRGWALKLQTLGTSFILRVPVIISELLFVIGERRN